MTNTGLSSLAHSFHSLHETVSRTAPVFGIAIHQTGESTVTDALKHGTSPLEYAVEYYLNPDSYFAHYVVGYDGTIIQVCNENEKAPHVGFQPEDRQAFLTGSWKNKLPSQLVDLWQKHWPGVKSPAHLFPGASPNNVFIGVEMLPVVKSCGFTAASWLPEGRFTEQQHQAIVDLSNDIAERQQFPVNWHLTSRLTTHEDLNPLQRSTKKPPAGWDPGWLRVKPWFDLEWVRLRIHTAP